MLKRKNTDATTLEIEQIRIELARSKAREQGLLIEREMWVEQGRQLQNQVQTWQRMYASLFDQLGRGVVTDKDIQDNLALATEAMRQPITAVEAVRAAFAMCQEATQGQYTSVGRRNKPRRVAKEGSDEWHN
ncbi:hypothetical protein ACEPT8_23555 [Pseudomonas aeruginosa]|uniref:hypothetical protein n=1 Tax=Pseudomonas aeruginosa TaxID=287 RepID=UPI00031AC7BB|nr:hypothetical protein [Pseudomonas aeruginosa]EIW4147315.1 hypothetical protein [Pseudomonas aeruginosa]EKU5853554.1 hypothetical protein [Pseudomonas aeruginosa]ERX94160.1 hypothetical protein Q079_01708 [Pseudomonas aeruginosa BL25]ETD47734.1 hypothetical protein X778_25565 [Pseudomonas aeruginosa VRFPA07]ETV53371.1 hypothetical protein Q043_03086 [Pseudomonas aeruginosa BWHPSA038]